MKMRSKLNIGIFFMLSFIFIGILSFFYYLKIVEKKRELFKNERYVMQMQQLAINETFEVVVDDLVLLVEQSKRIKNTHQFNYKHSDIKELQEIFLSFSKGRRRMYDQLRFINNNGDEVVRINISERVPTIVEEDELQNKKDRYYFKKTAALKENHIYISPADLNIEHSKIEYPFKPMVRFCAPVYSKENLFKGIIVINYLLDPILSGMERNVYDSKGVNILINNDGFYLHTDSVYKEFSFMFNNVKEYTFKEEHQAAWTEINQKYSGVINNNKGIYTFTTVTPTRYDNKNIVSLKDDELFIINEINTYYWKFCTFISKAELKAILFPIYKEYIISSLIILFSLFVFSKIISQQISKKQTAEKKLKESYVNLEKIVELRTEELVKAKEKAEESERLKTAFLTNMSHEIRTPMNGIIGFMNLLKTPDLTGKDQQKYIEIIQASGQRMLNTINDIVDISKIESSLIEVKKSNINITKKIESIFSFFSNEVKQKNLTFNLNRSNLELDIVMEIDEQKFDSILTNLIKNAIKFTIEGYIEVGYTLVNENNLHYFRLYVEDTGVGIPLEKQDVIFDRFIQVNYDSVNLYQGSGIGLSITKAYVNMMDGKINVTSRLGKGSRFTVDLPCNDSNIPDSMIQKTEEEYFNDCNVLITEDDQVSEMFLSELLKPYFKHIYIARDGLEALEFCKRHGDINLILMDIKMPNLNGVDAVKKIREFNKKSVIIAQTATANLGMGEDLNEIGFNDVVIKPINKKELLLRIKKNLVNTI
nr:ATP-binding protein [uncultured Carboxylicivirga sp.]